MADDVFESPPMSAHGHDNEPDYLLLKSSL